MPTKTRKSKPLPPPKAESRYTQVARWLSAAHGRPYLLVSIILLAATTFMWGVLGARLQLQNADQLIYPYLFSDGGTFQDASFPSAHSFLLKWPLFILAHYFGVTMQVLLAMTLVCVLLTIGGLAYVLWRIEKRPLVLGTLYLSLALMLLMIPYVPSAGTLLPVNMAMLTTRNLEYVVYIAALALLVRKPRIRTGRFVAAVVLLSLLFASDKLFASISIGGSLIALLGYALVRNTRLTSLAARWLFAGILSGLLATAVLGTITVTRLTHIAGQASSAGPYGLIDNFRDFVLGLIFGLVGLLTNLGANPFHGASQFRQMPAALGDTVASWAGLPTLLNIAAAIAGLVIIWKLLRPSLSIKRHGTMLSGQAADLAVVMLFSTLAAAVLFVLSSHEYAVDARYLAIGLFTFFICTAVYVRQKTIVPQQVVIPAALLLLAIGMATAANVQSYRHDTAALAPLAHRNVLIAKAMAGRHSDLLVGDYWRVVPAKLASRNQTKVTPFASCTTPQTILSSKTLAPDLSKRSFTYLLTYQGNLTDYPNCTLNQVTDAYGRPNASVVIEGNPSEPKELLLFYDHGINKAAATAPRPTRQPASVVPIGLDELTNTSCPVPTVMNVVAHQDDDLLFMNPDLDHDIKAGYCVRTVYLTAGDSGQDQTYWLSRMKAAEQAYSEMTGNHDVWIQRIVKLSGSSYLTIANPRNNTKVSLIFLNLPDGNLKGDGFSSSQYESLAKLAAGKITKLQTIDKYSNYTSDGLVKTLTTLMHTYQPAEIRTQGDVHSGQYADHSDHVFTGRFVKKAYDKYEEEQYNDIVTIPFKRYIGYPIHGMPANVTTDDLARKQSIFFQYAKFDPATCNSTAACSPTVYDAYLGRQYRQD